MLSRNGYVANVSESTAEKKVACKPALEKLNKRGETERSNQRLSGRRLATVSRPLTERRQRGKGGVKLR